jgi:hypothetical protein
VGFRYATNYIWTIFFKHPFSPTWLDFRHATAAASGGTTLAPAAPVRAEPPQG